MKVYVVDKDAILVQRLRVHLRLLMEKKPGPGGTRGRGSAKFRVPEVVHVVTYDDAIGLLETGDIGTDDVIVLVPALSMPGDGDIPPGEAGLELYREIEKSSHELANSTIMFLRESAGLEVGGRIEKLGCHGLPEILEPPLASSQGLARMIAGRIQEEACEAAGDSEDIDFDKHFSSWRGFFSQVADGLEDRYWLVFSGELRGPHALEEAKRVWPQLLAMAVVHTWESVCSGSYRVPEPSPTVEFSRIVEMLRHSAKKHPRANFPELVPSQQCWELKLLLMDQWAMYTIFSFLACMVSETLRRRSKVLVEAVKLESGETAVELFSEDRIPASAAKGWTKPWLKALKLLGERLLESPGLGRLDLLPEQSDEKGTSFHFATIILFGNVVEWRSSSINSVNTATDGKETAGDEKKPTPGQRSQRSGKTAGGGRKPGPEAWYCHWATAVCLLNEYEKQGNKFEFKASDCAYGEMFPGNTVKHEHYKWLRESSPHPHTFKVIHRGPNPKVEILDIDQLRGLVELCRREFVRSLNAASWRLPRHRVDDESWRATRFIGRSPNIRLARKKIEKAARAAGTSMVMAGPDGSGRNESVGLFCQSCELPFVVEPCRVDCKDRISFEKDVLTRLGGIEAIATRSDAWKQLDAGGGVVHLQNLECLEDDALGQLCSLLQSGPARLQCNDKPLRLLGTITAPVEGGVRDNRQRLESAFSVFIDLPPLAEREIDIPLLALHFLAQEGAQKGVVGFRGDALKKLLEMKLSDNVKGLRGVVVKAIRLETDSRFISLDTLAQAIERQT